MTGLVQYAGEEFGGGADKYHGEVATGYDAKRTNNPKWTTEQDIIEGWLASLDEGSVVLDCPIGTGRFLEVCKRRNHTVYGVDKSEDMLLETVNRANELGFTEDNLTVMVGDIRRLPFKDASFDASVMCRLTRWLSPDDCLGAMRELQRVTKGKIIFTARMDGAHARPVELFESVMDGWEITRNVSGYEEPYRILMAEKK